MSTTTRDFPFGAQLIGRTEKSLDALLHGMLAGSDLIEPEYVALRVCSDRAGEQRADLTAHLATAFRKGEDHAAELLERLGSAGLINPDPAAAVELTPAGRELHDRLAAETNAMAARLWGDLPTGDLAVAARVLSTVLRRATAGHVQHRLAPHPHVHPTDRANPQSPKPDHRHRRDAAQ